MKPLIPFAGDVKKYLIKEKFDEFKNGIEFLYKATSPLKTKSKRKMEGIKHLIGSCNDKCDGYLCPCDCHKDFKADHCNGCCENANKLGKFKVVNPKDVYLKLCDRCGGNHNTLDCVKFPSPSKEIKPIGELNIPPITSFATDDEFYFIKDMADKINKIIKCLKGNK